MRTKDELIDALLAHAQAGRAEDLAELMIGALQERDAAIRTAGAMLAYIQHTPPPAREPAFVPCSARLRAWIELLALCGPDLLRPPDARPNDSPGSSTGGRA